ncbi:Mitochondrial outer membrane protein IML2 [Grifola frondosa]|uniref:Mitochondrial outer membrane protein IML2 n=1 Tax=Grifola frondosa TaxID=5627 RepID=A0A1C7LP72_GRIFR|nr:Mitochondrial outer membrane protein IML2 [Grifola frondosa]
MAVSELNTEMHLRSATEGFDWLFSNELNKARDTFTNGDSPFHALGLGVCAFLEAALGMETGLMAEASRLLALSEAGARKHMKLAKTSSKSTQFPPGTEWELLHSDARVIHGILAMSLRNEQASLSQRYLTFCLTTQLRSAHSKFSKLYKTVYPTGLEDYATPATSKSTSRTASLYSEASTSTGTAVKPAKGSFFGRFGGSSVSVPSTTSSASGGFKPYYLTTVTISTCLDASVFNLVFSLLPGKIRGVVGFLGFNHDRKLALQALAVSAARTDVHAIFAGLSLMTYHGVVLLLSGYQADESHIIKQYRAIVDKVESRYPTGSLWILNRAKILRMCHDPEGAIKVLQDGLQPNRPHTFVQADGLLIFELAWTLLSQRRHQEAAEMFMKMTEINSWWVCVFVLTKIAANSSGLSGVTQHTTSLLPVCCYISLKDYEKAQRLLDAIPALVDKKKIGGKDLPTEVFIKKKLAFYKEKQQRLTGSEADYVRCIKISPAEELGIFWNTHARITKDAAIAHIVELASLRPLPTILSPLFTTEDSADSPTTVDLDTPDELAVRSLLLGIVHRTAGEFDAARSFLADAHSRYTSVKTSTWVGGVTLFELAVLDLKEMEARTERGAAEGTTLTATQKEAWAHALKNASEKLDKALSLATQQVDLSSRLDSRIVMLKDEIAIKREMLAGIAQ